MAQDITRVGSMPVSTFNSINASGNRKVSAIKPTSAALSSADQQLFTQVAAGGQRQLALSRALLDKLTDPQAKLLCNSEIEEQTGIAAKLQEIATAKNMTMSPATPDADAQKLLDQVQGISGAEADAFYINESGVKGHQLLQATMTKVSTTAKDATLRKLAMTTLPVIRTHLTVSRQIKVKMPAKA